MTSLLQFEQVPQSCSLQLVREEQISVSLCLSEEERAGAPGGETVEMAVLESDILERKVVLEGIARSLD